MALTSRFHSIFNSYGCSKGAADQYVKDWARVYGLKTIVFRHSSIYGGRQFATFDQGWIGWFCQKAIEQKNSYALGIVPDPFTISGTGKQVRDVLHVDDIIKLYKSAFDSKDKMCGHILNIGGGPKNSLSLLELFDLLSELLLMEPMRFTKTPRRASDQIVYREYPKTDCLLGWTHISMPWVQLMSMDSA